MPRKKPLKLAPEDMDKFVGNVLKLSVMQFQTDLGSTAISPRDEGRLRSNWFAQVGSSSSEETKATDRPQTDAEQLPVDREKRVFLTNNLDYAERLCFGDYAVSKDPDWFRQYFASTGQTVVDDAAKAAERLI